MKPPGRPVRRPPLRARSRLDSFRYAFRGLANAWRTEPNFRIDVVAAYLALAAGWWLEVGGTRLAVVAVAIALVLAGELFNTAVEEAVDLAMPRLHPKAGRAKDVSAGAVLVMAAGALAVALGVLLPAALEPGWVVRRLLESGWREGLVLAGALVLAALAWAGGPRGGRGGHGASGGRGVR
ncbi:MAG: diacylglycerol kinase family protein [Bacillota bacterium]|nr:diacylglycerol kinase family protein [Bacillota bacterium]